MNPAIPILGRDVHLTCDTQQASKLNQIGGKKYNVGEIVAGKIVRVLDNNAANLMLFPDAGEVLHIPNVPFSAGNQPGTWNWAERIGEAEQAAA